MLDSKNLYLKGKYLTFKKILAICRKRVKKAESKMLVTFI